MSTIAEELVRLQKAKSDFKDVIINEGLGGEEYAANLLTEGLDITESEAAELVALDGTLDTYPEAFSTILSGAAQSIGYSWVLDFYTEYLQSYIKSLEAI